MITFNDNAVKMQPISVPPMDTPAAPPVSVIVDKNSPYYDPAKYPDTKYVVTNTPLVLPNGGGTTGNSTTSNSGPAPTETPEDKIMGIPKKYATYIGIGLAILVAKKFFF